MEAEVRYHMLRPREAVARRKECPVAYVPLGTLEWHGKHNPLGADTLQAEGLAALCAQKGGGVAFPPLYYGENRIERLVEADEVDADGILREMDLPAKNFTVEGFPFPPRQQAMLYHQLLLHVLHEVQQLGFRVAVLVVGHYPLVDYARAAVLHFTQEGRWMENQTMGWVLADFMLVQDQYDCAGDHGGGWETSHLMALHPELVDLSLLPPKGTPAIGAGGKMDPQDSTGDFGREILDAAAEVAIKEVQHRMDNPRLYLGHGRCLQEGLWKKT